MGVKFNVDEEKAIAAIAFLASRGIPELTKGKICKLIFLADKHHLVRFGRPITGDQMCAMKDGPVPSRVLNMLNEMLAEDSARAPEALQESVSVNRRYENPHFEASGFHLEEFLSGSDLDALRSVVSAFGPKSFSELRRLTHDMPAYEKAWEVKPNSNSEMAFEDLFEEDDEAIHGALEEMIESFKIREAFASAAS